MRGGDGLHCIMMKMLTRLRYLLNEGFEVGKISGYDAPAGTDELGKASITFVRVDDEGGRRLVTEEFAVTAEEAERCSRLFLEQAKDN
jgi:hypothetical protein